MSRIACAFIARFELAVRARGDPDLWQRAMAVGNLATQRGRILVATEPAEQHGVHAGLPITQALALHPQLELIAPDPDRLRIAEVEICTALGKLSPAIDSDGLGAFFLLADGLAQIHPDEASMAARIRATLHDLSYDARIGIADRSLAAWVAARRSRNFTLVPPEQDASALANVAVAELGLPPPVLDRFALLGIRTAGQLAGLPRGSLAARLPEGARLERFCRGEEDIARPTSVRIPVVPEEAALDLDAPTEDLEPILFLFKSLLDRLLSRVAQSQLALAELLIIVRLDDRSTLEHRLVPASPTLDGRTLMDLLRLWLSAGPFKSAVAAIRLVAARVDTASAHQLRLFERQQDLADDALHRAAARLTAALGPMAVVRPVLADTLRPEARIRWEPFATPVTKNRVNPPRLDTAPSALVLRLLSPPEAVTWDRRGLRLSSGIVVQVVRADGPHHLTGEWWEAPFDRSYFWLTGAGGERFWVFRDEQANHSPKSAFLHAISE